MTRPAASANVSLAKPLMASQTEGDFSSQLVLADSIEEASESANDLNGSPREAQKDQVLDSSTNLLNVDDAELLQLENHRDYQIVITD